MAASRKLVVGAALAVCLLATSLTVIVRYKYLRKEGGMVTHYNKLIASSRHLLQKQPVPQLDNQVADSRCDCTGKALVFADAIPKHEKEDVLKRKKIELLKYRKRTESTRETLLFANGSVPLSYPTQGVTVVPEGVIEIPGLEVVDNSENKEYQVQLNTSHYGVLDVTETLSEVQVDGRRTTCLVMRSSSLVVLNRQLRIVVYVNTVYDIDARDLVHFSYLDYQATFPIRIWVRKSPRLYDPGKDNDINNKVTIITKTFLRYPSVKALLNSIRMFYPKIRIVVADDTRPVEDLQAENIDHYVMPFGAGWFSGRNLALSQVTTPYFLWVDDDYVFVNDTKLEKFVEVLDNTNMDLVSGRVGNRILMYSKMSIIPGGEQGDCLFQDHDYFGRVPGYPHCYLTPKVTNFFMGRTDEVRAVGFDPTYSRFGHTAFFVDAMGRLRMAACEGVRIDHKRVQTKEYTKFRQGGGVSGNYRNMIMRRTYFKDNIHCWIRP
ncbi:beta-1,4 N-acetylgalactosaminyltransferase 1-like [Branchiostoma lanceolatum]|uniref:beta-1,4 N-acetylgalactosaminyltransferase 1-like n=1 Tax=Branchiostoma lanceolatum TaxID=7740 RepID=UPI0034523253